MHARSEIVIATAIAAGMIGLFTFSSPGLALIVTFVPGVVFAWVALIYLSRESRPLPSPEKLLPVFGIALATQFLHFAEEYTMGFQKRFGPLYGGDIIPDGVFVSFNMASYAIFLLSALGVVFLRKRPLLIPVLFFSIYGVVGNAVSHLIWSLLKGGYFPGLITSIAYWMLGPVLLRRLGFQGREVWILIVAFGLTLIVTTVPTLNIAVLRAG